MKRDPQLTERNKQIAALTNRIDEIKDTVMEITGFEKIGSLNATYGGKHADYIDIKHEVIDTPEQFVALYLQGYLQYLEGLGGWAKPGNVYYDNYVNIRDNKIVLEWLTLFLSRTYLRNYEALSRVRPNVAEAEIWIGQKNAEFGIFITPRFVNGAWQNDRSEIRHFKAKYWTIGHILQTGVIVPDANEGITFADVNNYLDFFKNVLVRNSGSIHEKEIAQRYCEFVKASESPLDVPLLIPELRYGGKQAQHEHRLDFTVIDPYTMRKVGFELSPWSSHGHIAKTKDKTNKAINAEAKENFEKEMKKQKSYFRKLGISVLIYTDKDLENYDSIFADIRKYLNVEQKQKQLMSYAIQEFLAFNPSK